MNPTQEEFVCTPLGAAIVEALPDQKKKRKVIRDFNRKQVCPASELFTAEQVEKFYKKRGQKIKAC